jgi:hypothetical protein
MGLVKLVPPTPSPPSPLRGLSVLSQTNARAALPIVHDLLEHPVFSIRVSATNALERIDPNGGVVVPWDFYIQREERYGSKKKELRTYPKTEMLRATRKRVDGEKCRGRP